MTNPLPLHLRPCPCGCHYPEDGPCEHTEAGGYGPKQSTEALDVCEECNGTGRIAAYTVEAWFHGRD